MPGRTYTNPSDSGYRYGFNGQEKSREIGSGLYDAEFWEYDARLGRRWNVDPIGSEWISGYATFDNSPIVYADPSGAEADDAGKKKQHLETSTAAKPKDLQNVTVIGIRHKVGSSAPNTPAPSNGSTSVNQDNKEVTLNYIYWPSNDLPTDEQYAAAQRYVGDLHNHVASTISSDNLKYVQEKMNYFEGDYQNNQSMRKAQLFIVGGLAAPATIAGAPELFAVSSELALAKGALSLGVQAVIKGPRKIDVIGVFADAYTAPGLNALIQGSVNYTPFIKGGEGNKLSILGYNKWLTQSVIDATTTFAGGVASDAAWSPLQPLLRNPTEKSVSFIFTQTWLSTSTQAINANLNDAHEKK
jgi:RHS repeat-associated protein